MNTRTHALIAILDDEPQIRATLGNAIEDKGFRTISFARATEFSSNLNRIKPDLCVIDIELSDGNGLALLQRVTSHMNIPVIIISGRAATRDKIDALELGADDYLVKPFDSDELIARIKAVLRRQRIQYRPEDSRYKINDHVVDLDSLTLQLNDMVTPITLAEADILRVFLGAPHRMLSREQIQQAIGSHDNSFDRSIDVRISRLRAKFGDPGNKSSIIKTVYGGGYIFAPNAIKL